MQNKKLTAEPNRLLPLSGRGIFARAGLGVVILLATGIPAALETQHTLGTMFNAPPTWLPDDEPAWVHWQSFCERYRFDDIMMVSWPGCRLGSAAVDQAVEALQPLTEATAERPALLLYATSGSEAVQTLTDPPVELSAGAARRRLQGTLVSAEGELTCLLLGLTSAGEMNRRQLLETIEEKLAGVVDDSAEQVVMVGPPVEGAIIDAASQRSLTKLSLPSAIVAVLVCLVCLRSLPLATIVLVVAFWGQTMTLALVGWFGAEMNAVFAILPVLNLVLAISAGIHMSSYYREAAASGELTTVEVIQQAMHHALLPCAMAALTTCIGLLSLRWVPLWPVQWFGYVGAAVLVFSLLMLYLLLPAAMFLDHKRRIGDAESTTGMRLRRNALTRWGSGSLLARHGLWAIRRSRWIMAGALLLMLVAGIGVLQLQASVRIDRMLDQSHPLQSDYAWFESSVGSLVTGEIEVIFPPGVVPDRLKRLELVFATHLALLRSENATGALSLATFLPALPNPSERGARAAARRSIIRSRLESEFEELRETRFIASSAAGEHWRISVRYPHRTELSYATLLDRAADLVEPPLAAADPRIETRFLGSTPIAEVAQDALLRGLTNSFLFSFALIGALMMIVLRSIRAGMLSMLPNLLPATILFGLMGWIGIPLDIGIVMTASVALGIAIDDTLHFLFAFRSADRKRGDRRRAVSDALQVCGRAMIQTTLICTIAMAVYAFSDFAPTRRFSFLMVLLLAAALLGDLFFLPALLGSKWGGVFAARQITLKREPIGRPTPSPQAAS